MEVFIFKKLLGRGEGRGVKLFSTCYFFLFPVSKNSLTAMGLELVADTSVYSRVLYS